MNPNRNDEKKWWDRGEWKSFVIGCLTFLFLFAGSLAAYPYSSGRLDVLAIVLILLSVVSAIAAYMETHRQVRRSFGAERAFTVCLHLAILIALGLTFCVGIGVFYQIQFRPTDIDSWYVTVGLGVIVSSLAGTISDLFDGLNRLQPVDASEGDPR